MDFLFGASDQVEQNYSVKKQTHFCHRLHTIPLGSPRQQRLLPSHPTELWNR
jgi:hypothetical protein